MNYYYYPNISYSLLATSFLNLRVFDSIINMHLTIRNRNKSQHFKRLPLHIKTESIPHQKINITPSPHQLKSSGTNIDRESACKWIFSKCLYQSNIPSSGRSILLSGAVSQVEIKSRGEQNIIKREQKIRVMSNLRKSERSEIASKSLNKLKNFQQMQKQVTTGSEFKTKMSEVLQTRRCTNTHPTPIMSIQSSTKKKSILSSTQLQSCQYQLKLRISFQQSNNTKEYPQRQISPGILIQLKQPEKDIMNLHSKAAEEKIGHLRQSSNQLKITDPFEENKSNGTQYLKKKINFSEGKTQKSALIDYLYEPIKIIDEDHCEDLVFSRRDKNFQGYRSLAIQNIEIQNEHELTQARLNSEESVVLEKGLEEIFNKTGQFRKNNGKETKPAESLKESVIRHDTSVQQEFF